MPADRKRKILFIHIPKTAGTSISKYLNLYGPNALIQGPDQMAIDIPGKEPVLMPIWKQHLTFDEILNRYDSFNWPEYFKFTFVRNPWEREVSNFLYFKKLNRLDESFTLKDYILHCDQCYIKLFSTPEIGTSHPNDERVWTFDHHDHRQEAMILTHSREQSLYINSQIDFIGRYENLLDDMSTVCKKINHPFDAKNFPWEKRYSEGKKYTDYYDDDSYRLVEERYKNDIKLFDYRFGE